MHRNLGNLGCLILILVFVLILSIVSFGLKIIFGTPVGILLLGYLIYRFYFKKKAPEVKDEEPVFTDNEDEVIEVKYEERE
ncbi:MAG: hypothetical protein JXR88_11630 [Clostridia bacterium]|nr:hypothetical protein [Clostridia bacterium]